MKVSLELTFAQLCSSYAASPVTTDFHQQVHTVAHAFHNMYIFAILDCIFGVSIVLIEALSDKKTATTVNTVSLLKVVCLAIVSSVYCWWFVGLRRSLCC